MAKRGRKKSVNIKKAEIRRQVEIFGKLLATHEEMADYFDCSVRTIERYMQTTDEENITEFCRVYKKAAATSKTSLRRKQLQNAQRGDNSMLIWLGKQMLGQTDKGEVKHEGEVNSSVTIKEEFKKDYSLLTDEELENYEHYTRKLLGGIEENQE